MTTITALDALLNDNGRTEAEAESALNKALKVFGRIADKAELTALNVSALLRLHNGLAGKHGSDPLQSWKRPKTELVDRIKALGAGQTDAHEAKAAEETEQPSPQADGTSEQPKRTIGALVAELLMDEKLGYEAIVGLVKAEFPDAKTSVRSVASVAAVMRKRGVDVPMRRKKKG